LEWIVFYQEKFNTVYFITSKNEERDFLEYFRFVQFLNNEFKIKNFFELKEHLDKFHVILLYSDGTWEIIKEEVQQAGFKELYELNKEKEEEKNSFDKRVEKSKLHINQIFDFNKKKGKR